MLSDKIEICQQELSKNLKSLTYRILYNEMKIDKLKKLSIKGKQNEKVQIMDFK
jgi:hypothetical protein